MAMSVASLALRLLALAAVSWSASSSDSDSDKDSDKDSESGTNPNCDCYLTNGTVPTYFTNRIFFDFRNLTAFAGVPDYIDNATLASSAPPSSDYFARPSWKEMWTTQTWDNSNGEGEGLSNDGGVYMVNSRSNVFIQANNDSDASSATYLTLRTRRLPDFQTASEFQSTAANFQFVSMRMLARTVGAAGAVTGMFTYRDATGKLADVQESDVEILTRGPRDKIQYTNQPSYTVDGRTIPKATRNATTPDWSDWGVHRLDWTPKQVVWYVNGDNVTAISFQTPKRACDLHFSAWSDGGTWSGNMTLGLEAAQHIQWIEVLYNTTTKHIVGGRSLDKRNGSKNKKDKCKVVCSIDQTAEPGTATVLWESAAPVVAGRAGRLLCCLAVMGVMLLL